MTNRKITFHVLKMYKKNKNKVLYNKFDFDGFAKWFVSLSDQRKIFNLSNNKFTSLDLLEKIQSKYIDGPKFAYFGMMSTGNHGSRRNLKNSVDNTKRPNPKKIDEGEEQENYFILSFNDYGDIELVYQNAGRGVKADKVKNYLDKYFNMYLTQLGDSKEFDLIEGAVVSTASVMIDRLSRVTKTKVYIDKSILSDELDLSHRTLEAKEDLIIEVRARRSQDIKDFLNDVRQKIVHNSKIDKIWIQGKDHNGNVSQFYLNQIQKSTYISIDIDTSTASLVKKSVKDELLKLI